MISPRKKKAKDKKELGQYERRQGVMYRSLQHFRLVLIIRFYKKKVLHQIQGFHQRKVQSTKIKMVHQKCKIIWCYQIVPSKYVLYVNVLTIALFNFSL